MEGKLNFDYCEKCGCKIGSMPIIIKDKKYCGSCAKKIIKESKGKPENEN